MRSRLARTAVFVMVWMPLGMALGGCLCAVGMAAGTGAGAIAYSRGEVEATERMSLDGAWAATLAAVDELQFPVKQQQKDAVSARLVAERADGGLVRISIDAKDGGLTRIRVRTGTFGNESVSRVVIDRIKAHYAELTGALPDNSPHDEPPQRSERHH
jgi:hypothetical protein